MSSVARALVVLALGLLFGAGAAGAQDAAKIGTPIAATPGVPYQASLVPLRADARRLTDLPQRYATARAPKALAVSEDGIALHAVWQSEGRVPRDADDVRRMALQVCELRAGAPCRLAAVDGTMVQGGGPVPALPRDGAFAPDRMPFWSKGSIERSEALRAYVAAPAPKAMAVAPADAARMEWAAGPTLDAAREAALAACTKRARRDGIACLVVAENDRFVLASATAGRRQISGAAARPKALTLVAVMAYNCPPCAYWEAVHRPPFVASATAKSVRYFEVKAGTYRDTRARETDWPEEIRWLRDSGKADSGTPRFLVVSEGKILLNARGIGGWTNNVLPLVERAAAEGRRPG